MFLSMPPNTPYDWVSCGINQGPSTYRARLFFYFCFPGCKSDFVYTTFPNMCHNAPYQHLCVRWRVCCSRNQTPNLYIDALYPGYTDAEMWAAQALFAVSHLLVWEHAERCAGRMPQVSGAPVVLIYQCALRNLDVSALMVRRRMKIKT